MTKIIWDQDKVTKPCEFIGEVFDDFVETIKTNTVAEAHRYVLSFEGLTLIQGSTQSPLVKAPDPTLNSGDLIHAGTMFEMDTYINPTSAIAASIESVLNESVQKYVEIELAHPPVFE